MAAGGQDIDHRSIPAATGAGATAATVSKGSLETLLASYRGALDAAVSLSATHVLPRLKGRTVIFCDVSGSMQSSATAKLPGRAGRGSARSCLETAALLGLMMYHASDAAELRIFSSPPSPHDPCHLQVPVSTSILDDTRTIAKLARTLGGGTDFPFDYM